jgi:hypothetical protein
MMAQHKMTSRLAHFFQAVFASLALMLLGCGDDKPQEKKPAAQDQKPVVTPPEFNSDSSFAALKKQVDFGPRVPGSNAHNACGDWLVKTLISRGATVQEQKTSLQTFDGKSVPVRNIIASFQPENKDRVLLCAHWDTRPFADKETENALRNKPIDGANDGASGVAVLMEIARVMQRETPKIGIDILLLDVEDSGAAENSPMKSSEVLNPGYLTSWCLGSQYWAKNPHRAGYRARFGILLDMVGAADATFNKEKYSTEIASDVVNLIWSSASKLGYGKYFLPDAVEGVIDDHVMISRGGVRCIDIIDTRPTPSAMGLGGYTFGSYHHTHKDNLEIIDKSALKATGQTLLQVLYNL